MLLLIKRGGMAGLRLAHGVPGNLNLGEVEAKQATVTSNIFRL